MSEIPLVGRLSWRPTGAVIRAVGRALWRARYQHDGAVPAAPFVLAANHFSFLDPPLLAAAFPRPIRFLALDELIGHHRLLDLSLDAWGVIHVSRAGHSIAGVRAALRHLQQGGSVGVFPEGRRVSRWGEVGVKRGAAWLAVRSRSPLVPAAVEGSDEVMGIDNRFRPGRLRVRIGEPMHADPTTPDPVAELMERWQAWVTEALA